MFDATNIKTLTSAGLKSGLKVMVVKSMPFWGGGWSRTMDTVVGDGLVYTTGSITKQSNGGNMCILQDHGSPGNTHYWPPECMALAVDVPKGYIEAMKAERERHAVTSLVFTDIHGKGIDPKVQLPWEHDYFAKQLDHLRVHPSGVCAFYYGTGTTNTFLQGACHANIFRTCLDKFYIGGLMDGGTNREAYRWYFDKYIFHPKFSPWKQVIEHLIIVRNKKNGDPLGFIVTKDNLPKIDKKLFCNMLIATRHAYEYADMVESMFHWNKILKHRRLAFVVARHFKWDGKESSVKALDQAPNGHQHLVNYKFARYIMAKPGITSVTYRMDDEINQFGNDLEIWSGNSAVDEKAGNEFHLYYEKRYAEIKKTKEGSRFSYTYKVAIEDIVSFAKDLKEYASKIPFDAAANNVEVRDDENEDYYDDDYNEGEDNYDDED